MGGGGGEGGGGVQVDKLVFEWAMNRNYKNIILLPWYKKMTSYTGPQRDLSW